MIPKMIAVIHAVPTAPITPQDSITSTAKLDKVYCTFLNGSSGRKVIEDEQCYTESTHFWEWLLAKCGTKRKLWVFAHGAGKAFTLLGGPDEVRSGRLTLDWAVLTDPPVILALRAGRCPIMMVDVRNYTDADASMLTAQYVIHKDTEPKLSTLAGRIDKTGQMAHKAVTFHVLNLLRWFKDGNYGNWKPTAAGLAWSAYRHRFMNKKILIHGDHETLALEIAAYYGGRAELWRHGTITADLYTLDVNSLFPAVMSTQSYPVRFFKREVGLSVRQLREATARYAVIARVRLNTNKYEYPVRHGGRVRYARGQFDTFLAGPELIRALFFDEVKAVGMATMYEQTGLFKSYVEHFFSERSRYIAEGNLLAASLAKTMLNALYGKFAQRVTSWENVGNCYLPIDYGHYYVDRNPDKPLEQYRAIGGKAQRMVKGELCDNTSPAIAAYVTSYARMYMDHIRQLAGVENVYHQYIDSITVNKAGYVRLLKSRIVDPSTLGAMRLTNHCGSATFYSPGDVQLGDQRKICGIPDDAVETAPGEFSFVQQERLATSLKTSYGGEQHSHKTVRRLKRDEDSDRYLPSGIVAPFTLPSRE